MNKASSNPDIASADAIGPAAREAPVGKAYRAGTHRAVAPAATIARLEPLMARMDITRVADVTGLDRIGVPVVAVYRPNARSVAVSQGKGLDREAAIASGLMEAAELFHAEHIDRPLRLGSAAELARSCRLADVARLPRQAGDRYHDDLAMLWIEGVDLVSGAGIWTPYEVVRANYTLPLPPGSGCFNSSSNGLASGNHRLEAMLHGLCEVIERDATTLWHGLDPRRRDQTRVAAASIGDPACRDLVAQLDAADFDVGIWETTSDVGVPAYLAILTDRSERLAHIGIGAGCHPARGVALARALTEAVQVRTTYIAGARDDLDYDEYGEAMLADRNAWARSLVFGTAEGRAYDAGGDTVNDTFNADVDWVLQRLKAVGVDEVICVDLTRDDFDLPVVRIVVPGLEGPDDFDGYVPGERAGCCAARR